MLEDVFHPKASSLIYGSPEVSKAPNQARQPCSVLFTCTALHRPLGTGAWCIRRHVWLQPNRTFSNWTDTGPALTQHCEPGRMPHTWKEEKRKPQRLAFEAGNLPSSGKQSAFVKRDSRKRNGRHCMFPLLKDMPLGGRQSSTSPFLSGLGEEKICHSHYLGRCIVI